MDIEKATARRILELCVENNLSVSALASISNVNPSTIYEFLAGRTKCPTIKIIKQICDGLKISLSDFFFVSYFN